MLISFDHRQYVEADQPQLHLKVSLSKFLSCKPTPEDLKIIPDLSKRKLATWPVDPFQISVQKLFFLFQFESARHIKF